MKAKKLIALLLLALCGPEMMVAQQDTVVCTTGSDEKDDRPGKEAIQTIVDEMPEFPGGEAAMFKYLGGSVNYPEGTEAAVEGVVFVSFVVERDGDLSAIRVLRSVHPSLDREAIRVVKAMPKWNPGKQNGKVCRVQYNLPIAFRLK